MGGCCPGRGQGAECEAGAGTPLEKMLQGNKEEDLLAGVGRSGGDGSKLTPLPAPPPPVVLPKAADPLPWQEKPGDKKADDKKARFPEWDDLGAGDKDKDRFPGIDNPTVDGVPEVKSVIQVSGIPEAKSCVLVDGVPQVESSIVGHPCAGGKDGQDVKRELTDVRWEDSPKGENSPKAEGA